MLGAGPSRAHDVAERHGLIGEVLAAKLNLGLVELHSGRPEVAVPIFEELLGTHARLGRLHTGFGFASIHLGQALYQLDELERAQAAFADARAAFAAIGFRSHFAHALQGLAAVEARLGSAQGGARLLGEAAAVLEDVGASGDDFDRPGVRAGHRGDTSLTARR
jgi:tetratricopeptide (TPR) repeat protein